MVSISLGAKIALVVTGVAVIASGLIVFLVTYMWWGKVFDSLLFFTLFLPFGLLLMLSSVIFGTKPRVPKYMNFQQYYPQYQVPGQYPPQPPQDFSSQRAYKQMYEQAYQYAYQQGYWLGLQKAYEQLYKSYRQPTQQYQQPYQQQYYQYPM